MKDGCCGNQPSPLESEFGRARAALLAALRLRGFVMRSSGEHPLGEIFPDALAYTCAVQRFYAAQIAAAGHLRPASDGQARRLLAALGYQFETGVAAQTFVAGFLSPEGGATLANVALRSTAFDDQAPQVFEGVLPAAASATKNVWTLAPVSRARLLISLSPLTFKPDGFGLAPGRVAVIQVMAASDAAQPSDIWAVAVVTTVRVIESDGGRSVVQVELAAAPALPASVSSDRVRVWTPTVTARVTPWQPADERDASIQDAAEGNTQVYLDSVYRQLVSGAFVVAQRTRPADAPLLAVSRVVSVDEVTVVPPIVGDGPRSQVPASRTILTSVSQLNSTAFVLAKRKEDGFGTLDTANQLTLHFAFVEAGRIADISVSELVGTEFAAPIPIEGSVARPAGLGGDQLEQDFLIEDSQGRGAKVPGVMTFTEDGHATFQVTDISALGDTTFRAPIKVYGNLIEVTRGETVENEILGSGDARQARQTFKLKKKPLTYVPSTSNDADDTVQNTLSVRVNGRLWREVRTFYGTGPSDEVYTVRHDEEHESYVMFGDGRYGARLPSGVENVIASYRFGSGEAAPPAGAITQLAKPVKGIRGVRSPIAAQPGKDPEDAKYLRKYAPRTALLLSRAVSAQDFEALANKSAGVIQAVATWSWIDAEQQAGVQVFYIGDTSEDALQDQLSKFADPTLPIRVTKARAVRSRADIELEVDPTADRKQVERDVLARLIDSEDGILAPRNVPIGAALWMSRVYDVIMDVPGVVSIATFRVVYRARFEPLILIFKPHNTVGNQLLEKTQIKKIGTKLVRNAESLCAGTGTYFDFSAPDALTVTALTDLLGPVTSPKPELPEACP